MSKLGCGLYFAFVQPSPPFADDTPEADNDIICQNTWQQYVVCAGKSTNNRQKRAPYRRTNEGDQNVRGAGMQRGMMHLVYVRVLNAMASQKADEDRVHAAFRRFTSVIHLHAYQMTWYQECSLRFDTTELHIRTNQEASIF